MKLLLTMNVPYFPPFGGAGKGARILMEQMVAGGHQVEAIIPMRGPASQLTIAQFSTLLRKHRIDIEQRTPHTVTFTWNGVTAHAVLESSQLQRYLVQHIQTFTPDVIVVSTEDPSQRLLEIALTYAPGRVVYLVQTPTYLPFGPQSFFPSPRRTQLLQNVAAIVAVSQFVQQYLWEWAALVSTVVYLPVYGQPPFPFFGNFEHGFLTMINPCRVKGISIFVALAQRFPQLPFAAVPTWGTTEADQAALAALPNVQILPPAVDFDQILSQTRILLMPSLWEEAFGCTTIEAMRCGIPVIASAVGGLGEAKLETDLLIPVEPITSFTDQLDDKYQPISPVPKQPIEPWATAVHQLTTDYKHYQEQADAARVASINFITSLGIADFEHLLQRVRNVNHTPPQPSPPANAPLHHAHSATPDHTATLAKLSPEQRAQLIQKLRDKAVNRSNHYEIPLPLDPRPMPIPLSFAQQRFWFLEQFVPENTAYTVPAAFQVLGCLNVRLLVHSLNCIIARHEILRTNFRMENGQPIQEVTPARAITVPVCDLQQLTTPAQTGVVHHQIVRAGTHVFDLTRDLLVRACLVRLHPQEHVLLLTFHHIIADGQSLRIFIAELVAFYAHFTTDQPINLAHLPLQYADYAIWQRQWVQEQVVKQHMDYWRKQLASPPTLALATDKPRPIQPTFEGATQKMMLSVRLTHHLKSLSQREDVTLFMLFLTVFQTFLFRYTGQNDIAVGSPVTYRHGEQLEHLIGCFTNMIVFRTDVQHARPFRHILQHVRQICLDAYAHQAMPFERLVEELHPDRHLAQTPFMQVALVVQEAALPATEVSQLTLRPLQMVIETAKFDLTLAIGEKEQCFSMALEYRTDLFESHTIERMLQHLRTLLENLIAHPDQPVASMTLVPTSERHQVLGLSNAKKTFVQQACLQDMWANQVSQHPDSIAVVYNHQSLTYRALDRSANQLAHYLRQSGVAPETRVGLLLERSLDMLVSILGVLKAGGTYVPIDPRYPVERSTYILQDSQADILITERVVASALPPFELATITIDDAITTQVLASMPHHDMPCVTTAHQVAYIIYTSGSTGRPKGVMVEHRQVIRLFAATEAHFAFGADDVWGLFHSYAFDFSVWEVWGALLYGGQLVIVPFWISRSPTAFYDLICAQEITILNQTPSAFYQLIQVSAVPGRALPRGLRCIVLGGEALEPSLLQPWFDQYGDGYPQVVNMYGITETTVHVTYRLLQQDDVFTHTKSVIGKVLPDLDLYTFTPLYQLAPINVPGELYVGGAGVARGYVQQPALTAERFVPHPLSRNPGERLYRTGDQARYLFHHDIEYLGRMDQQVKLSGFRIELGEIETVLRSHPTVSDAIVTTYTNATHAKLLVAYLVGLPGKEMDMDLQRFLKTKLPTYMIPAHYIILDAFPLTINGKIDYGALPSPDTKRPNLNVDYVPPQTPNEELLVAIWEAVLDVEPVGRYDNFFTLGGDSIQSVQVVAQAKEHGIHLTVQELFHYQTIIELAQQLTPLAQNHTQKTAPFSLLSFEDHQRLPNGIEDAYPLTKVQEGMLFHSIFDTDVAVYHDLYGFHLRAHFDLAALYATLRHMCQRHPILRTSFDCTTYSEPLQLVHTMAEISFTFEDLSDLAPDEQLSTLQNWYMIERRNAFNVSEPSLLRVFIHRRGNDTFQVTLSFHHAILDGWSVATLITEWLETYISYIHDGKLPSLVPLQTSFRDFVALEQQYLLSEDIQQYWAQKLVDSTVLHIPRTHPVPHQAGPPQVHGYNVAIPSDVSRGLKTLARSLGIPLKTVLLAIHLRVLCLLSGQADVVTGLVSNTRPEMTDGDNVLGVFLNTLPLRIKLAGGTWHDLIQHTFAAEQELLAMRYYPLAAIIHRTNSTTLFETAFNFMHFHIYQRVRESAQTQILEWHFVEETNFTLIANFGVSLGTAEIRLNLAYDTTIINADAIQTMGSYYLHTCTRIVTNLQERYETAMLLSKEEQHQVLRIWNETTITWRDQPLAHLVEAQAARTPDALAAVCGTATLTYHTLDQQSNQLAHYLHHLGIGREQRVGICIERSLPMVVSLLAVLKSGGTYVPLDPEYPVERLAFMIHDTQLDVLLTTQTLPWTDTLSQVTVINLTTAWPEVAQCTDTKVPTGPALDHIAYIMYTSGSTGRPKGVQISHKALVNALCSMQQQPGISPYDTVLAVATLSFDIAALDLYLPLLVGAKVVIATREEAMDGVALATLIARWHITFMQATPATWQLLLGAAKLDRKIGTLLCGGEALTHELSRQLCAISDAVWNMYGTTETTLWSTICRIHTPEQMISVGYPIANTQIFILDDQWMPVPIGVTGNVYIGGEGLASGYLNRPDLTAERFIPNPFDFSAGNRLYDTGDIARYHHDGQLEYVGRRDQQVKIRGFRIELREIETVLSEHPQVAQAAVVVTEHLPGDQRLQAYLVSAVPEEQYTQNEPSCSAVKVPAALANTLCDFLRDRLPVYMIPSMFWMVTTMPLSPNGKVNRRLLTTFDHIHPEDHQTSQRAPRTMAETVVANVWKQVLQVDNVDIHESFFALGGHSLLIIRVIAQLRTIFQVELSPRQVFEAPSIAQMVEMIGAMWGSVDTVEEIASLFQQVDTLSEAEARRLLS